MGKMDGIYEEYADLIYRYLYRLTRNPDLSEELTQETFFQALKAIDNFNGDSKVYCFRPMIEKIKQK